MSKNFSPKTSPLNSVGISIACVVIIIIVITSTIKNVNEKLNYFEELKSSKWQESQTLITPYHQVKVTQYRDNSQRLVVSQNGYEIHIQFCDAKIKLVCNLVHKRICWPFPAHSQQKIRSIKISWQIFSYLDFNN